MIGVLGGIEGVMGILLSVPIGVLSDRVDRRNIRGDVRVLRGGGLFWGHRRQARLGVGSIGIFATSMGIGFAAGSAIGGRLAEDIGFGAGFWVAAAITIVAFALLRWGPARQAATPRPEISRRTEPFASKLALLGRNPVIVAACLGNLGMAGKHAL